METIERADQLVVGDELKLRGSYVQVRALHLPGAEVTYRTTMVWISPGSGGQSWPVSKRVIVTAAGGADL